MEHSNFGPNVIYLVGILILYYIILYILCIIKNDSSESKKVIF